MSLLVSVMLNAVVAAGPATPLPWYNFDDYPMKAFERQWQGTTAMSVLVAPSGQPIGCTVDKSSGYDTLDRQTCFVAMKRVKFSPARGPDGQPVYGVYRSQVTWSRPDQDFIQREPGPDLEVMVNALPAGTKEPAAVKLAYFVDAAGNASACTVLPDSAAQPKALIDAACGQLLGKAAKMPVQGDGAAVPAVKTAAVVFIVSK